MASNSARDLAAPAALGPPPADSSNTVRARCDSRRTCLSATPDANTAESHHESPPGPARPRLDLLAGAGTATPCPCGNAGGTGLGSANSVGPGGALVTTGSSSVAYDDLTFTGTGLVPGQPALLFVGDAAVNGGAGVLFGDGLRCAGGGVVRLEVSTPEAAGSADFGAGHGAQGGWTAGDTRYFQVWYRDPAGPCGQSFNTTHALAVELKV